MKLLTILFIWTLSTFSTKGGDLINYYNESSTNNDNEIKEGYSVRKKEYPKKDIPSFSFSVPEVVFVPHDELQQIYKKITSKESNGQLYGFTPNDKTFPIFISNRVQDLTNPFHASIIIHEMVHYIQRENDTLNYDTPYTEQAKLEQQAKAIQCMFLERHGIIRQDPESIVKS